MSKNLRGRGRDKGEKEEYINSKKKVVINQEEVEGEAREYKSRVLSVFFMPCYQSKQSRPCYS